MGLPFDESVGWTLEADEAYPPRVSDIPVMPGMSRNTVRTVTDVERC